MRAQGSFPLGLADSGRRLSTRAAGPDAADDPLSLSALTIDAHHRHRSSVEQGGVLCRPTSCDADVTGRERPPSRRSIAAAASSQGSLTPCLSVSVPAANTTRDRDANPVPFQPGLHNPNALSGRRGSIVGIAAEPIAIP